MEVASNSFLVSALRKALNLKSVLFGGQAAPSVSASCNSGIMQPVKPSQSSDMNLTPEEHLGYLTLNWTHSSHLEPTSGSIFTS